MTVAPPYTGPTGPAPTPGLAAFAYALRYAYALNAPGVPEPEGDIDTEQVRRFSAFLVGHGPPAPPEPHALGCLGHHDNLGDCYTSARGDTSPRPPGPRL